jgi:hypothetical protein
MILKIDQKIKQEYSFHVIMSEQIIDLIKFVVVQIVASFLAFSHE